MDHIYEGNCPDETQPDSRDENCPACSAMIHAQNCVNACAGLDMSNVPEGAVRELVRLLKWSRDELWEEGSDALLCSEIDKTLAPFKE